MSPTFAYIPAIPTDWGRRNGAVTQVKVRCYCNRVSVHTVTRPDTCREVALDEVGACECGEHERATKEQQYKGRKP